MGTHTTRPLPDYQRATTRRIPVIALERGGACCSTYDARALQLTKNPAERALLGHRLTLGC